VTVLASLLHGFDLRGVGAQWTAALIEPLERRGDELAAGLLLALAAFSHQPWVSRPLMRWRVSAAAA
jgi:hypothetical protein